MIIKNWQVVGKKVKFKCVGCNESLKTKLRDAGSKDFCPACGCQFISPGMSVLQKQTMKDAEEKRLKELKKKQAQAEIAERVERQEKFQRDQNKIRNTKGMKSTVTPSSHMQRPSRQVVGVEPWDICKGILLASLILFIIGIFIGLIFSILAAGLR